MIIIRNYIILSFIKYDLKNNKTKNIFLKLQNR